MSSNEPVICPNCNFLTSENYCARCGQETHLHEDTFGALIMHFIGHYFHYDSKFWKTMKTLFFNPGKLTIAYWDKQRMRYIAPISMYIFISAVFFITASLPAFTNDDTVDNETIQQHERLRQEVVKDSVYVAHAREHNFAAVLFKKRMAHMRVNIDVLDGNSNTSERLTERLLHIIPDVFFFLIPFLALVLKVLLYKRKDLLYVNHIIFALHLQTMLFCLLLLSILWPFDASSVTVAIILGIVFLLYFIAALKRAYNIRWVKAGLYSILTILSYAFTLLITFFIIMAYI